jgi:hypothetical protein
MEFLDDMEEVELEIEDDFDNDIEELDDLTLFEAFGI